MKNIIFHPYCFLLILFGLNSISFSQSKRIISLTPSITQELYFLGEENNVIGITNFCKKINKNQQIVGTYLQPNIEKILNLKPDIILMTKEGMSKDIVEQFDRFKLKYVTFEPINSYKELKKQFLDLATIFNKQNIAKEKIYNLETTNFEKKIINKKQKPEVAFVVDNELLIVASHTSYIGEILNYSGVENIIKTEKKYPQISIEELTKVDPDYLIISDMGMKGNQVKKYFKKFSWLNAVKNNRLIVVDSNIFCQPTVENFWNSVNTLNNILK